MYIKPIRANVRELAAGACALCCVCATTTRRPPPPPHAYTCGGGSAHTLTITLANGSVNTLSLCRTRRRLELHCARPNEWCEFYAHRMLAQHTARIFRYVCTLPPSVVSLCTRGVLVARARRRAHRQGKPTSSAHFRCTAAGRDAGAAVVVVRPLSASLAQRRPLTSSVSVATFASVLWQWRSLVYAVRVSVFCPSVPCVCAVAIVGISRPVLARALGGVHLNTIVSCQCDFIRCN